jgi:signal transduction histidine kinase
VAFERDMPRSTYPAHPAHPAGSPRTAPPPLTKRLRAGHWLAIDFVVAGFAALCDLAVVSRGLELDGRGGFPTGLLLAAAAAAPVAARRRAPAMALGALLVLAVLLARMTFSVTAVIFLSAAYVLYTVTVSSSKRTGVTALGLVLATMLLIGSAGPRHVAGTGPGVLIPVALASIIAWMSGYSVRQRRLYVVRLQYQAASSAVAEERLRIARELHDVVAHSMSVIAVQAGYGQYVIDTSPDGARDALGAIQATSRDALEEMRRMLGVLRQQDIAPPPLNTVSLDAVGPMAPPAGCDGAAPLAPAPGLADLDRLIKRTCGAGVRVSPVPAGIDLSAYRIIQEALTNVVKHAGGSARCTVNLYYGIATLDVRVIDDGGPGTSVAGAGHGIVGMRERVNLCGGTFKVGPLAEGGFLVAATLPVPLLTDDDAGDASDEGALAGNVSSGGQA